MEERRHDSIIIRGLNFTFNFFFGCIMTDNLTSIDAKTSGKISQNGEKMKIYKN